ALFPLCPRRHCLLRPLPCSLRILSFFSNDPATTEIYTLSLHDALPIFPLLVWLTPDLRIKKSLLKCNWTIRKRLPRCILVSSFRSEERFSRNAETDLVCRLLLEKKKITEIVASRSHASTDHARWFARRT